MLCICSVGSSLGLICWNCRHVFGVIVHAPEGECANATICFILTQQPFTMGVAEAEIYPATGLGMLGDVTWLKLSAIYTYCIFYECFMCWPNSFQSWEKQYVAHENTTERAADPFDIPQQGKWKQSWGIITAMPWKSKSGGSRPPQQSYFQPFVFTKSTLHPTEWKNRSSLAWALSREILYSL